ncbi:MAG: exo-beta-N-acetylmuramidase NamZ domain-containing protein [Chitinophagaceae bacterium]
MIEFGIDSILQQNPSWKKQRIGFVTNHAATTNTLEYSRKALLENGFNVVCLFSPEHGLDIKGEDGAFIENGIDTLTQLPIVSLYGKKLAPTKEDVANLDCILFDIPDIGCRFYTYLWTLTHVLEACAKLKKPLIILDRPNPISGDLVNAEGPILNEVELQFVYWKMGNAFASCMYIGRTCPVF